jgi:hypothetical protein
MEEQIGPASLRRRFLAEAPYLVAALPEMPRLFHQWLLARPPTGDDAVRELAAAQRTFNRLLAVVAVLLAVAIVVLLLRPL